MGNCKDGLCGIQLRFEALLPEILPGEYFERTGEFVEVYDMAVEVMRCKYCGQRWAEDQHEIHRLVCPVVKARIERKLQDGVSFVVV